MMESDVLMENMKRTTLSDQQDGMTVCTDIIDIFATIS